MPKWKKHDTQFRTEDDAFIAFKHSQQDKAVVDAHNADIDALTAEVDEWQSRCESMVAKRTLAKYQNVKMWKVPAIGESLIDIGTDQCVMVGGKFWREDLVIAHNNDIIALNHCADILADVISGLTAERDELQRRLAGILDRLPDGGVWCYACNRATVPIYCKNFYEHIPREYKQMKTTFHCPICKRETYAKDSCVDSLRAIAEGREG